MITKKEVLKELNIRQNTNLMRSLVSKYKFSTSELKIILNNAKKNNPYLQEVFNSIH